MKKIKKLTIRRETLRALTGEALAQAMGGAPAGGNTEGAACPRTAFPPCATVAGACTGTCPIWTQNTCNAPCTQGTCDRCQFPF